MARQRITDRTLLKDHNVAGERLEIWDDLLPGFGVRITARGVKSFFVFTRLHRQPLRITLGNYPALGLSDAREAARQALQAVQKGEDPRRKRPITAGTIEYLIDEFKKRHLSKLRPSSAKVAAYYLESRFLSRFRNRRFDEIKRGEIRAFIDDIADEGRGTTANRTLAAVRRMFSWAVERDELEISPCHGIRPPVKEKQRSRFLTMDEVELVWRASDVLSPAYRAFIRILILTGQRRGSVEEMCRSQIKDGVWTVPREQMKGDRTHSVPLSGLARSTIASVPVVSGCDLVFTTDGQTSVAGYSKAKGQLDKEIARLVQDRDGPPARMAHWRIHDLRRTAGTHIARIGHPRLLVSKILGHAEGGVTQIYELYSYDDEKRRALEAWACEIQRCLSTSSSQVRHMAEISE
jgi:integrase